MRSCTTCAYGLPVTFSLFEDGAEEMSGRLKKRKTEAQDRLEFLETVWYESKRAGLEPSLVAPGSTRAMTGARDT
jgi:hypothetical protein